MNSFQTQVYRVYPQLAEAAHILVQDYNKTLMLSPATISINACFGKNRLSDGNVFFDKNLTPNISTQISTMLSGFSSWCDTKDWHLIFKYHFDNEDTLVVKYEKEKENSVALKSSSSKYGHVVDFAYQHRNDSVSSNDDWPLCDYVTRVAIDAIDEQPENCGVNNKLEKFNRVEMCVCKTFNIQSITNPNISYEYEMQQIWEGSCTREIETAALKHAPTYICFSIRIVNVPIKNIMAEKDKYLMFLSLLIKMQDFMEYPVYYNIARTQVLDPRFFVVMTRDEKKNIQAK